MPVRTLLVWFAIMSSGLATTAVAQQAPAPDAAVATEIERRFSDDRSINAQAVDIHVRDGVVVLTGRVPSEDAKARATKIANAVDGVEEVENRLTPAVGGVQKTVQDPTNIPERMPGNE